MKRIILDTNFLLIPHQFKVDIFTEITRICDFKFNLFVIDRTLDELNGIADSTMGDDRKAALLALLLLRHNIVEKIDTDDPEKDVDTLIVDNVNKGTIVATQDKELKQRVQAKKGQIITMRQKKHLILQ